MWTKVQSQIKAIKIIYEIANGNASGSELSNAPNPSDTFPRNFRIDREVDNLLQTCY